MWAPSCGSLIVGEQGTHKGCPYECFSTLALNLNSCALSLAQRYRVNVDQVGQVVGKLKAVLEPTGLVAVG